MLHASFKTVQNTVEVPLHRGEHRMVWFIRPWAAHGSYMYPQGNASPRERPGPEWPNLASQEDIEPIDAGRVHDAAPALATELRHLVAQRLGRGAPAGLIRSHGAAASSTLTDPDAPPRHTGATMDLKTIERAHEALGQAVERYDAMGWYDEDYAHEAALKEAQEAFDALEKLRDALEVARGQQMWIFVQPYPDLDPYAGTVFAASAGEARRKVVDRWRSEAADPDDPYFDQYLDEDGDWFLRIQGPFVLPRR